MATGDMYDVVIVGGGPGGLSAAIYAMRAALKTVLIEKAVPGGQINLSDSVENYPGFTHIGGAELAMRFAEHARSYGLEEINEEVAAIEPGLTHHTRAPGRRPGPCDPCRDPGHRRYAAQAQGAR